MLSSVDHLYPPYRQQQNSLRPLGIISDSRSAPPTFGPSAKLLTKSGTCSTSETLLCGAVLSLVHNVSVIRSTLANRKKQSWLFQRKIWWDLNEPACLHHWSQTIVLHWETSESFTSDAERRVGNSQSQRRKRALWITISSYLKVQARISDSSSHLLTTRNSAYSVIRPFFSAITQRYSGAFDNSSVFHLYLMSCTWRQFLPAMKEISASLPKTISQRPSKVWCEMTESAWKNPVKQQTAAPICSQN